MDFQGISLIATVGLVMVLALSILGSMVGWLVLAIVLGWRLVHEFIIATTYSKSDLGLIRYKWLFRIIFKFLHVVESAWTGCSEPQTRRALHKTFRRLETPVGLTQQHSKPQSLLWLRCWSLLQSACREKLDAVPFERYLAISSTKILFVIVSILFFGKSQLEDTYRSGKIHSIS